MASQTRRGSPREDAEAEAAAAAGRSPEVPATQSPQPPVPTGEEYRVLQAGAWRWLRWAAMAVTVWVVLQLLSTFWAAIDGILAVTLYVVFGGVVALLAAPAVNALERRTPLGRGLASALVLLGGIAAIVLVLYLAAGPVVDQAQSLAKRLPTIVDDANRSVASLRASLRARGIDVGSGGLPGASGGNLAAGLASMLLTTVKGTVQALIAILVTLVVAFWLLKDGAELRAALVSLLPGRARSETEFALDAVSAVVGGYVRAQLLLALLVGTLAGLGCWIFGIPYPLVIALTAGVFELIPLVGAIAGGLVAMALALTVSVRLMVTALVVFVVIHLIEGYGISPRVQAKFVQLHPVIAMLALVAGADVGGFLGALFAVPAASLLAVFIRAAVGDWRHQRPDLFTPRRRDPFLEGRRRRLLREFRFFNRRGDRAAAEAKSR